MLGNNTLSEIHLEKVLLYGTLVIIHSTLNYKCTVKTILFSNEFDPKKVLFPIISQVLPSHETRSSKKIICSQKECLWTMKAAQNSKGK
jgi:hypothetical protein